MIHNAQAKFRAELRSACRDLSPESREALSRMLGALRAHTQARLAERESAFAPLLPGDDAALHERVGALADFCRGYVLGLVEGGVHDLDQLPVEAREAVNDFMIIADVEAERGPRLG